MNVFVIGGTGFISSRLVRHLLDGGHHVTVFTRGRTPVPFEPQPRLAVRHGNRHDEAALREALDGRSFDVVYDMVAYTPAASRLAVDVFRGRTSRFIHCSTISVYMVSDDVHCPITEDQDDRPLMSYWPHNPFGMDYGVRKRECEAVLWEVHDASAFPVSMLRPTYVSGPDDPMRRDFFWIERILDGGPLLVPGSGDYAFQQVYVDDVARAFAALLEHPSATVGKAYNVASEDIYSLNDYLERLGALLEREVECVPVDQEVFDAWPFSRSSEGDAFPFNTQRTAIFSLDRIKRDLGYRSTPFEEWMSKTIRWFTEAHDRPSLGYEHREDELTFIRRWRQRYGELIAAFGGSSGAEG